MSVIQRYRNTIFGDIEFAGNSLLFSERSCDGGKYIGSTAAVIATELHDPQVTAFPERSTTKLNNDGSSANLNLSENAKVIYAELIWGGIYFLDAQKASENDLERSIRLTLPDNTSYLIKPLAETAFTQKLSGDDNAHAFTRSAVITDLVKSSGGGCYTVSGITGVCGLEESLLHNSGIGWLIAAVYEDKANCALRSIRFYEGGFEAAAGGETKSISFPGLCVDKESSVLLAAFGADSISDMSAVEIKPSQTAEPLALYGPDNSKDIFFASLINPTDDFCTRNGFNITRIDLRNILNKRSDSPELLFKAGLGSYILGAAAISSPEPLPEITVTEDHRAIADMPGYCEYIIKISSSGNCDADLLSITVDLDGGFTMLDNSLTIGGFPKYGTSIVFPLSLKLQAPTKGGSPVELSFIVGGFTSSIRLSPGKFKIKYILGNITSPETVYKLSAWKAGGQRMPQHEIGRSICQLLWDKLYAYNIDEVKNFEIQYRTARRYMTQQIAVLSCNYAIKLYYIDKLKKEQLSVKNGSVSFFDFPEDFGENYTVKIIPMPIKLNGNEVIFKAAVRITKQDI